jgi:FkbM family methyltransferase
MILSWETISDIISKKWSKVDSIDEKYQVQNMSFSNHFKEILPHIVNNDNPFTNGEYTLYSLLSKYFTTILDVGVRDDIYYIEKSEPGTKIYLFEPNPIFFKKLSDNVNNYSGSRTRNINLINAGCSDRESVLQYYKTAESFVNRFNEVPHMELPVVRLDTLQEIQKETTIDFLKVDTEGFEIDVLRGCEGIFSKIRLIQFEYGGTYPDRNILLKDVVELLKTHGFSFFYYIFSDGLITLDSEEVIEHKQYSNILVSKFSFT